MESKFAYETDREAIAILNAIDDLGLDYINEEPTDECPGIIFVDIELEKEFSYIRDAYHVASRQTFVTVYEAIGGWKVICMVFNKDIDFYDTEFTGIMCHKTKGAAIKDAKQSALNLELRYIPPETN